MNTNESDLAERLRALVPYVGAGAHALLKEAAAEIERLRRSPSPDAGVGELVEALRPCVGWLKYAYGHVSSVTSEKVKDHLPKIEALLSKYSPPLGKG